ncbi:hypothetical protein PGTUg99_031912 [Puccinia graminis f. sp. tritici]|uniref:Secreted protein n=1 Tax=Puccinia graminis f. sp. tritici TaxID=56615 RepID=A0A5B0N0N9_PUCGR|nr:hypothetical protein PGTUg99_031912 [Puccinia graminis f. sp. tritici]
MRLGRAVRFIDELLVLVLFFFLSGRSGRVEQGVFGEHDDVLHHLDLFPTAHLDRVSILFTRLLLSG